MSTEVVDSSELPRRRRSAAIVTPPGGIPMEGVIPPISAAVIPPPDVSDVLDLPRKTRAKAGSPAADNTPLNSFFHNVAHLAARDTKNGLAFTREMATGYNLGIPSPSLAFSWGLGSNVLPLSRVLHLAGKEGSFKSGLMAEMFRWLLELTETGLPRVPMIPGSIGYFENENKFAPDYFWSILENRTIYDGIIRVHQTKTANEWQLGLINLIETWEGYYNKGFGSGPFWFTPLAIGLDSIVGTLPESVIDSIKDKGSIDVAFPALAKQLTALSALLPRIIGRRPVLFIGTNHLKVDLKAQNPQFAEDRTPGGQAWKHVESLELRLKRIKLEDSENMATGQIQIRFYKNCLGTSKRAIEVPIGWIKEMDAQGKLVQWTMWDWPTATIKLLTRDLPQKFPETYAKVKEIIDLNEVGAKIWSNRLGIAKSDKVSRHAAGVMLEQSPQILDELLPAMKIKQGRFYRPGTDFFTELNRQDAAPDSMAARVYRAPAIDTLCRQLEEADANPALNGFPGAVTGFVPGHPHGPDSEE